MKKKPAKKKLLLKKPSPVTASEKKTLAKILAKARAYKAYYASGGS